jgi:hypothetical protein
MGERAVVNIEHLSVSIPHKYCRLRQNHEREDERYGTLHTNSPKRIFRLTYLRARLSSAKCSVAGYAKGRVE